MTLRPSTQKALNIISSLTGAKHEDIADYAILQFYIGRLTILAHDLELTDDDKEMLIKVADNVAYREMEGTSQGAQKMRLNNLPAAELAVLREHVAFMCWRMEDLLSQATITGLFRLRDKLGEEIESRSRLG